MGAMARSRVTISLSGDVLRAVRIRAARSGGRDSQVTEEVLRRDLVLEDLAGIRAGVRPAAEAGEAADRELHAMRRERRGRPPAPRTPRHSPPPPT
jgi:hypothetical protein